MITNYINKLERRVIARGIVMTLFIGLMVAVCVTMDWKIN